MATQMIPVILAGGQGTRLWPLSRTARPKQFLSLTGKLSPFQETLMRVKDEAATPRRSSSPMPSTASSSASRPRSSASSCAGVLLEPVARNTTAAIVAAAVFAEKQSGAQQRHPCAALRSCCRHRRQLLGLGRHRGHSSLRAGRLVTFGITPTGPETGYGYIEAGEAARRRHLGSGALRRKARPCQGREPCSSRAASPGTPACSCSASATFLGECSTLSPESFDAAIAAVEKATTDLDFIRLDLESFSKAPNISVDYAIFEKTKLISLVPVTFFWSDLGSWDAVWKVSDKDAADNAVMGDATLSNTTNSFVLSEKAHVAVEGLDDVAVIATEDAVYVGKLSEAQKVGAMVKTLKGKPETQHHHRNPPHGLSPLGRLFLGPERRRFQVKRLFVKPGKKLSLQKHHHRAEHWVVVSGTAEVTIDGNVQMLSENESVYLPLGCVHRLANPGKILLELIEVQTGSYLGEDDIIRIEDEFGRA